MVAIAPLAGSNGVADLRRELASGPAVSLENGTEPFTPNVAGANWAGVSRSPAGASRYGSRPPWALE